MPSIKCYDKYGNELDHLTQWDINVELQIYDFPYEIAPICHFASRFDQEALTVTSTLTDGVVSVAIPNIMLTVSKPIKIFVFLYDTEEDTGRTMYTITLPVAPKPQPNDYEYSDNVEIIEITALKARLEALVARAEEAVDVQIGELEDTYQNTIQEIKDSIADDVDNLNKQITNANTGLIEEIQKSNEDLTEQIETATENLTEQVEDALETMIDSVADGSPKDIFSDVAELAGKSAGVYLYLNSNSEDNGYLYYWDGTTLSDRLLYYAGTVLNDGSITLAKFSNGLKEQCLGKVITYVLPAEDWSDNKQEIDVSSDYTVTEKTMFNIALTETANNQMLEDGCKGIYIVNNENSDNKVWAHLSGNTPTADLTVQLTVHETA